MTSNSASVSLGERPKADGSGKGTFLKVIYRLERPLLFEIDRQLTPAERMDTLSKCSALSGEAIGLIYYALRAYNVTSIPIDTRKDLIKLATRELGIQCSHD